MFTVAILAQGTSRAVADTQAFLVRGSVPSARRVRAKVACVRARADLRQQWRIARWVRSHGLEVSQRSNPLSKPPSHDRAHAGSAAFSFHGRAVLVKSSIFCSNTVQSRLVKSRPVYSGPIPSSPVWRSLVQCGLFWLVLVQSSRAQSGVVSLDSLGLFWSSLI
jgi:hypothetical protein